MRRSGYSFMTLTASASSLNDDFWMSAEFALKLMPLMTPVNFFTALGSSSGQPSLSWKPFFVSSSLGHLSSASRTPSPSLSGSGQPSSSWKPSLSSACVGALVGGTEDAVAVGVLLRAAVLVVDAVLQLGLVGALVHRVGDAVPVVVEIGAAVVVLEVVLVLGLVRALVHVVRDVVAVGVLDQRRGRGRRRCRALTTEAPGGAGQELPVGRDLLVAGVGQEHGARIGAHVDVVGDRVLHADAAVEVEIGVLGDLVVGRVVLHARPPASRRHRPGRRAARGRAAGARGRATGSSSGTRCSRGMLSALGMPATSPSSEIHGSMVAASRKPKIPPVLGWGTLPGSSATPSSRSSANRCTPPKAPSSS